MKLDFTQMEENAMPNFKGGELTTYGKLHVDDHNRIMQGRLTPGASIGLHTHTGSSEVVYILSGTGKAIYDGEEEKLGPGDCHYCPKGHTHSLINTGSEPLEFFAVVPNQ